MSVGWGQDCVDGVEVELWGECYNIVETIELDLSNSGLTGEIPPEIGNLTNLRVLYLYSNQLTGEIPIEIGNLINLRSLKLGHNLLTGEIPSSIGNLSELYDLSTMNNQLEGELPSEFWTLTNLSTIQINHNQLEGELPPEIGNINFEFLWLDNNEFTFLPESICNLDSILLYGSFDTPNGIIYNFTSGNNSICDQIPICLETSVGFNWGLNLEILGLEYQPQNCEDLKVNHEILPKIYNLSSPYPNPFNPTTTISFSIPQSGVVSLNVYDITGKLLTTLINEQLNIGYHSIDWDGTNQSSGMYLVRMESGDYVETQKLLLVK